MTEPEQSKGGRGKEGGSEEERQVVGIATYVNGDKVNLGVTVLSSLGGGHFDNLAGTV